MNRFPLLLTFALVLAGPAAAQDVVDPIGSLLDQVDEETAEARGVGAAPAPAGETPAPAPASAPQVLPPAAPVALPATQPSPYNPAPAYTPPPAPRRPLLARPVNIDEHDKTPEAPLNYVEQGYEDRLRSSFAAAQGMQGPLDGAWTLRTRGGQQLYSLQLVDKGLSQLEGAWRDPRRKGATEASGFLADIYRSGSQLTASFYPRPGAGIATLTLSAGPSGQWTGELTEDGDRTSVTLKRD